MRMYDLLQALELNKRYKIRHRLQGVQRYDRKSVLVYLGVSSNYNDLDFSGRDFARDTRVCGTETLRVENIISVERVADDADLYINARW
jgi:hypothetical protein